MTNEIGKDLNSLELRSVQVVDLMFMKNGIVLIVLRRPN